MHSESQSSFVVECYWPGVTESTHALATDRIRRAAAELTREGRSVLFVGSIMVPGEETVFCLLDGSEADVRVAGERAELPFERVLASLRIDGGEQ